jgi:hypothetical protein
MTTEDEATALSPRAESTWLITATVVKERPYGPGGEETRIGTKHFRGGAKVYVIGAHWGMCESVTVIGHHRSSGRYAKLDMRRFHLEHFRMTVCYSPKVIAMVAAEYLDQLPTMEKWEQDLAVIDSWPAD